MSEHNFAGLPRGGRSELPGLARELAARYPAVDVVGAWITRLENGELSQGVEFKADLEVLRASGLVTDEMIAYAKAWDARRRAPRPPRGDRFDLFNPSPRVHASVIEGVCVLTLYTDSGTDGEHVNARDLRREARRVLKRVGVQTRALSGSERGAWQ